MKLSQFLKTIDCNDKPAQKAFLAWLKEPSVKRALVETLTQAERDHANTLITQLPHRVDSLEASALKSKKTALKK